MTRTRMRVGHLVDEYHTHRLKRTTDEWYAKPTEYVAARFLMNSPVHDLLKPRFDWERVRRDVERLVAG